MNKLSDEEKKAIEWLKKADWFSARLYSPTILTLIETQQKEIEELRKQKLELINKQHVVHLKDVEKELLEIRNALDIKNAEINMLNNMIDVNYISKDKIKEKIEEYKKLINDCIMNDEEIFCKECTERCSFNQTIDVLQSLLKEE